MMTNLFSSFESSIVFSMNWMSSFLGLTLIPLNFWFIPNRFFIINYKILFNLHKEFKNLSKLNMGTLIFISMFYFILFNNFMELFPYIFTSSSHLVFSHSMALLLWISFMIYGWFNTTMLMLAHLVTKWTPPILMPLIVCIETISNIIRPGTLAVRLSAKMIAGHILMTLLKNTGRLLIFLLTLLIMSQILLIILEMAVSMIQS